MFYPHTGTAGLDACNDYCNKSLKQHGTKNQMAFTCAIFIIFSVILMEIEKLENKTSCYAVPIWNWVPEQQSATLN